MPTLPLFPEIAEPPIFRPISRDRLPTNTTTYQHAIHRWFNFIAGFSPEFVEECCADGHLQPRAILLDPFAGCGTAPLVASLRGMRTVGFEPHPIFFRIGLAKLRCENYAKDLRQVEHSILAGLRRPEAISILPDTAALFLKKLFPEATLAALLGAREELKRAGLADNPLAFLILCGILDRSSHSQTDGIYKAPTSKKLSESPSEVCSDVIRLIRADISAITPNPDVRLFNHSSETMTEAPSDSVDIVVTSPPYLNNFDYAEMTRMYLYFWSIASSWGEISDTVRSKLIVNTTTALKGHKDKQEQYRAEIETSLHSEFDGLVHQLRTLKKERAGKKEYDYLVYPYFAQMTRILRECLRVMRNGAPIHIMVADAALYGVHISTPQFLQHILDAIGFQDSACTLVRTRGHRWILSKRQGSASGLGEYHVTATK